MSFQLQCKRIFRLVDLTAQVMAAENLPDALNESLQKLLVPFERGAGLQ
jgi:hypothetical protein